jgi:hypothetical protein
MAHWTRAQRGQTRRPTWCIYFIASLLLCKG